VADAEADTETVASEVLDGATVFDGDTMDVLVGIEADAEAVPVGCSDLRALIVSDDDAVLVGEG
jgi:hypothetical protein